MTSLFQHSNCKLHSGRESTFLIDCNALTDADLEALAHMAVTYMLPPFGEVIGIPRGGLRFAAALRQYSSDGPPLIVDDVYTTGISMGKVRREVEGSGRGLPIGVVMFARGPHPAWIHALLQMPEYFWGK